MNRTYWKAVWKLCLQLHARNVKMRWIVKVTLQNPKSQKFFYKKSCAITCIKCKKHLFLRKKKKHLMLNIWRMLQTSCAVTCIECGKQFFALRKVLNRKLQWMREYFFFQIHQTSSAIPCAKHTCRHHVQYHVLIIFFSEKEIYQTSSVIPCA